jgi:replicative DNA helicase
MLVSEFFLNQCISTCVSLKNDTKQSRDILDSIYYILKWHERETPKDKLNINLLESYDLAFYLAKYRSMTSDFNFDIMLSGLEGGRFSRFVDLLKMEKKDISPELQSKLSTLIYNKRKLCELTSGRKLLEQKLMELDSGSFDDDDTALKSWEEMINKLNTQLMEVKKLEAIEEASFLDVLSDDYTVIMDKLRNQSDKITSIKSGLNFFRDNLPANGFEPCRLYLIGGTSGVGKSVLLVNFVGNAVLNSPAYSENEPREVLLYITAENLVDESLERLYCQMTGIGIEQLKKLYNDPDFSLSIKLKEILKDKKLGIQIIYVPPKKTTVRDLEAIIDKIISSGKIIKAIYLDYLDLIRSGCNITEFRHELGEVATGLKNIAVTYRFPVITVTQLNRGGYDKKMEPSLSQMSESMQKIDNSDFVVFVQNDGKEPIISIPGESGIPISCKNIRLTILKNRSGPVNDSANMIMKDRMGPLSIFNYRIEEKTSIKYNDEWAATTDKEDQTSLQLF